MRYEGSINRNTILCHYLGKVQTKYTSIREFGELSVYRCFPQFFFTENDPKKTNDLSTSGMHKSSYLKIQFNEKFPMKTQFDHFDFPLNIS